METEKELALRANEVELKAAIVEREARIRDLESKMATKDDTIEALVIANNAFRSAMLARSSPPAIDGLYLAKSKITWSNMPFEDLMQFYEIFSAHTQIFHDLAVAKKGQGAIRDHILAKARADAEEVKAFRERQENGSPAGRAQIRAAKAEAKAASAVITEADKNKKKAIQSLMTSLNLNEEAARAMLDRTIPK